MLYFKQKKKLKTSELVLEFFFNAPKELAKWRLGTLTVPAPLEFIGSVYNILLKCFEEIGRTFTFCELYKGRIYFN